MLGGLHEKEELGEVDDPGLVGIGEFHDAACFVSHLLHSGGGAKL